MMFDADLRQPVGVSLAGAEVAPLDRVVKEAVDAVAVVAVVLGGVDPALGGDRVGPARAVVIRKAVHLVALLAERGGRGRSRPGPSRRPEWCASAGWRGSPASCRSGTCPISVQSVPEGPCHRASLTPSAYPAGQHGDRHRDKAGEYHHRHALATEPAGPARSARCSSRASGTCSRPRGPGAGTGRPSPGCKRATHTRPRTPATTLLYTLRCS